MQDRETMKEFVARFGITIASVPTNHNPNCDNDKWSKEASHWMCTLAFNGRTLSSHYSMGSAHRRWKHDLTFSGLNDHDIRRFKIKRGERVSQEFSSQRTLWAAEVLKDATEPIPPTADDVLGCLASDASGYDSCRDFEDWCVNYGYDTDSRKAERTYRIIAEQAKQLRHFLGSDYEAALNAEW